MTRRRQLLQAGALGTAATFTTSLYAQTRPTVRWRMAASSSGRQFGREGMAETTPLAGWVNLHINAS